MGRSGAYSAAGWQYTWNFAVDHSTDPAGIYFTIRTRFLPIRLFPDMVRALVEKKKDKNSLSSFQALVVSTATRVGMGNLVGVVAAISAGGAGAVVLDVGNSTDRFIYSIY